jgi:hypothetical protein
MSPSSSGALFRRLAKMRRAKRIAAPRSTTPPTPQTTPMMVLRVFVDMLLGLVFSFWAREEVVGLVTAEEVDTIVEVTPSETMTELIVVTAFVVAGNVVSVVLTLGPVEVDELEDDDD